MSPVGAGGGKRATRHEALHDHARRCITIHSSAWVSPGVRVGVLVVTSLARLVSLLGLVAGVAV